MAVVAKKDIEILTKQLLYEKCKILETIQNEYIEIDPALLHQNIVQELEEKMNKINQPAEITQDEPSISLDDCEAIFERLDNLDEQLTEPKAPIPHSNVRKESHGMKRYGSMTDMNKTLLRTLSTQSLNSTQLFATPYPPAPRMQPNHNCEQTTVTPKLTTDEIVNHNKIKDDIELRLNSMEHNPNNYKQMLSNICQTYKTSFERLNGFFAEVQKIQSNKALDTRNEITLNGLDQDLIHSMDKLNKALSQIRFIAENQNIYDAARIKHVESLLSDDLTDILEHFYRTVNS